MIDAGLLEQVLGYIHNWFVRGSMQVTGCRVEGGSLPASITLPEGVWYSVSGSLLNDGMHLRGDDGLVDETFDGTITTHVIPKPLLAIVEEMTEWQAKNAQVVNSPYQSESFGGYSYSLRGGAAGGGMPQSSGWQSVFGGRFVQWRKLS